jgi:hypothetical protein
MNNLIVPTILFCVILSFLLKYLVGKWKLYQIKVPGMKLFPFVIEFFYAIYNGAKLDFQERLELLTLYSHTYNGMVKFWFGKIL